VADNNSVQRRCAFAIEAAVGLGIEIMFTEQVPHKLGTTSPDLVNRVPAPRIFAKTTFSAFADPVIRDAIMSRATEHVLLCGLETSVCVYQSALDAVAAGMNVTLLSDCVGSRRTDDAQVCLEALVRAGVHVLPAETVFYALLHDVDHPFFRAYTQLVKEHA
jgi:nicotinamidase-related amidase